MDVDDIEWASRPTNISVDPKFRYTATGGLSLRRCSPVVDMGADRLILVDATDTLLATLHRSALRPPLPARPISSRAFRFCGASRTLPSTRRTLASADFCPAVNDPCGSFSRGPRCSAFASPRDTRQISQGKFDRLRRTTAGITLHALGGYGLRHQLPVRPTLAPPIRFLSIGPRLRSTLPSDAASQRRPCASRTLRLHQAG